ncbi:concanavalin A-like lectin/glucanase superfamily protein [Flavobacterium sp. 1]|uniref:LamG-like jellyroll fold domain-containing protein n=1 Tax=Flavobacterium sp. 1 TaxID=2035200 RepID=UPI000C234EEA|nr:LamG-like jellyroll fold domain-containing protein [Flavobacterium sp. 1]PJJ09952.1 concanavalin A-like lectin/glucanase superfamily protein [Flavobacterium sp. 1]
MKKILFLIAALLSMFQFSFGQTVSSYTFTAIQGSYISLTGVAGVVDTSLTATADTGVSTSITLPFAVTFAGTVYSSIQVSPNGWLSFGTPTVTDAQNSTNSLANAAVVKPVLFPLWDDLKCTVKPRYITTGIYPHRRFKVEWSQQKWDAQSSGDTVSFQVWFFETTNVIEYLYSQGATAVSNSSGGASIGMCDANGNYLALTNSGASPSADYTVFTDNISTKPASGQIYRFTPPSTAGLIASKYCFTASAATYGILTGTSPVGGIGAVDDDGITNPIPLNFPFTFAGTTYTNVIVSPNGWLTFGSPTITNAQNAANSATNAALIKPALMPLWDDLKCTEKIRYITTDAAPNRIFKIEWYHQKWDHTANGDVISFQIWLYEGTNLIEYYYNQEAIAVKSPSATIGIYDANGNYLTLSDSGASPTAQSGTFTTTIASRPASGQVYQFKPPPTISYPGNAYIAIGKVAVTQTGASGGTYSATPPGLSLNASTGEVNLAASAGGTFTIAYTVAGCSNASAVMTIFPLLPVPTATVTEASCAAGTDGAITITNMNNAIKFISADNDYIDLGSPLLSNKSAFTIEGWIKFNIADVTGRMSLFGQNDAIEFGFANSSTIELSTPATGAVTATLPASLGDGSWHHIAAVGNGSTVKIYLNGVSVAVTGGVVTTSNYGSSSYNTKIGSGVYNATGDSFTGQIAKLGLYSTALSASGIVALAIGLTTYSGYESGIIAGYNIAVGSGTTIYSYPAGNNGTFQNTPEWIDPYTYYWQEIGNAGFSATTKNLTGLSPGDYRVTVSLIGVSSPNAVTFSVGSASVVTASAGTGVDCSSNFTANWVASAGAVSYLLDAATDSGFTNFVSGFNNLNVGNVTSYAVTGVPPGNIYYRVRKNSNCGVSTSSNVITYDTKQINSPTAIGATNVLCSGFNANWNAVSDATAYYLDVSTDPAFSTFVSGYNDLYVGNVTSVSVISLASGFSYYYRVRSSNVVCGTVATPSNVIQVDIDSAPTAPVVGSVQQISCSRPAGSAALSGLPTGDWILNFSSGDTYSGSGTTVTIPGLATGDYTVTVSEGRCFSANSANISIASSPISETSWDGSTWSNGLPSLSQRVIFNGGTLFTVSADTNMCSCQIHSGSVIVNSGVVLFIDGALDIDSSTSFTFENNASLVQGSDTAVNSGNIIYKRTTSAVKDFDYVYWSSPVADQTLGLLSPSSDRYWSYADGAWVAETSSSIMTKGKGYIARVPRYTPLQNAEFIGVPYNGSISITAQGELKTNLIGNPYASAINADLFITDNASVINGALYFWTHNTSRTLNNAGTKFVYTSDDYATYNFTGGVATAMAAKSTDVNGDGIGDGVLPSGNIAAGQSFFVVSKIAGDFTFTNSMRVSTVGGNSQFFKQAGIDKTAKIEKNRIWLNLTNDGGAFKQLLVGYVTGATNDFDNLYDGAILNGNAYVDFFSINNSKNYTIQGRRLPFDAADEVPLGYKTTLAGTFQISIEKADGVLTNRAIYLEDKTINTIYDLTKGSYSFTTAIGEFKNRFVLRYNNTSLSTDDFDANGKGVVVSLNNSQIKINSFDQIMSSVKVYDLKGSLLYENNKVDKNEFIINHLVSSDQVLIVMTQLENGKKVSEKIIFHD